MPAVLDLGRVPLEEEAVANRQQSWAQEHADKTKGENASEEPEEAEHQRQVVGLIEEIRPENIVNGANEEQTPRHNEDAPPEGSLDK